jgi:hypothetical protein
MSFRPDASFMHCVQGKYPHEYAKSANVVHTLISAALASEDEKMKVPYGNSFFHPAPL